MIETAEEGKYINSSMRLSVNSEGKEKFCCGVYPGFSVRSKAGMKFVSHDACISHDLQEKIWETACRRVFSERAMHSWSWNWGRGSLRGSSDDLGDLSEAAWKCLLLSCM